MDKILFNHALALHILKPILEVLNLLTVSLSILIADREPISRYGAAQWLRKMFKNATIYMADDFGTLNKILQKKQIDLLLYDLRMNDSNSYETVKRIRQTREKTKIIVFSWQPEELYAVRFLKAGADSYLPKSCEFERFSTTVLTVCSGKKCIPNVTKVTVDDANVDFLSQLSNRELEVCKLLGQGYSLITIARTLYIHESSVSTYRRRIYKKLGIKKLPELVGIIEKTIPGWPQVNVQNN